ncbi:hypothetical protein E6C60_3679 [Paenibacillus algicola]|uniref:Uncharacterized protein n=1 Tax=Paenibacillus algicola TaxID=2565926 RepID=A0A4P8XND5_9BACL|nr:hypothetical protein [Paenibacillus algicola]QCT04387.1 hypothetical protein E6C60_3679 [Paenibacillus algicola]
MQQLLFKASHFNEAMLQQWIVEVYQEYELIDYGGIIEKQTKSSVRINGIYYMKESCQFIKRNYT